MWISKTFFNMLLSDNRAQQQLLAEYRGQLSATTARLSETQAQRAKDELSIDWMRHRINALERERAVLLNKAAGVVIAIPEIVPTRPGTMTESDFNGLVADFNDMGDERADRLGLKHDGEGYLVDANTN